jgi:hypothetical protein
MPHLRAGGEIFGSPRLISLLSDLLRGYMCGKLLGLLQSFGSLPPDLVF